MSEHPQSKDRHELRAARIREDLCSRLEALFNQTRSPEDRALFIRQKLEPSIRAGSMPASMLDEALVVNRSTDRGEFLKGMQQVLEPYIQALVDETHPIHQTRRAEAGHIPLSGALSYELKEDGWMVLHVPENYGTSPTELYVELRKGMRALAALLQEHPDIKGVRGKSWIVGDPGGQRLVHSLGFTVASVDREEQVRSDPSEYRPVAVASRSREEVLARYADMDS